MGAFGRRAFSLTLPATRAAAPSLGIGFVSLGRTIGAGILAVIILWWTRQPLPRRSDLVSIVITSLGVVIGFPFLTTPAMAQRRGLHGAIVVGLLPLSTAVAGVWLARERPKFGVLAHQPDQPNRDPADVRAAGIRWPCLTSPMPR